MARVKVNLNNREFAIEGSEEFVHSQSQKIDYFLHFLKNLPQIVPVAEGPAPAVAAPAPAAPAPAAPAPAAPARKSASSVNPEEVLANVPKNFGKFYESIPVLTKDVDKILAAAYYVQAKHQKDAFTTREASKALKSLNVRMSNPSNAVKLNADAGKMEKLASRVYRVTEEGVNHLQYLAHGRKK